MVFLHFYLKSALKCRFRFALVRWYYIEAERLGRVMLLVSGQGAFLINTKGSFFLSWKYSVRLSEVLAQSNEFPVCCWISNREPQVELLTHPVFVLPIILPQAAQFRQNCNPCSYHDNLDNIDHGNRL